VEKQCDHCGKILPSDTIRFCPGCGKIVASSRKAKRSLSDDPPAWMKQLETSLTNNRSKRPLRELNVKVWDEEATGDLTLLESGVNSGEDKEDVVESLPTSPLMTASSPDQLEDTATRPYAAQPLSNSHEIEKPDPYRQRQAIQTPRGFMNDPAMQQPVTPAPILLTQFPPAQPVGQTPPGSMPVPPLARPKKNNRARLSIVFGFLFILLLGGVIAWVIVAQPFAVPEITKTTQNFNSPSLGMSLQYPRNWVVAVNKQNGTVSFYDDNHTDQVKVTVVAAGNQGINQYMTKTVSSLGMTGLKTQAELSFAGTTWQQIRGSVQESGANYTATLLVTMHGQYFYTILQLAPSSTYPFEEQLVFSKMRSSFQF
jgi:hypothetical protein